jgi:UDP-N-acetylmuramoylalanine--D-glutamate ligase
MGEIELAYRVIRRLSLERGFPVRWFGITGTNGKSTTTALLYELMKKGKKRCLLAGNIGISLSGEALKLMERGTAFPDIDIVLELSSFQLETMKEFRLDGSALLNITDDHMDRYQDLSAYGEAKASIFINQGPENFAVINADDENAIHYSANCRARKYFVSAEKEVEGFFASGGNIFFKSGNGTRVFGGTADVSMLGLHNLYNAMTSSLMAYLAGIPSEAIISALREFPGLEHRIEFSGETQGVKFYNDSKGTNVGAVIKSLESFDRGVILIAGGRDKNSDFTVLNPYLKKRAKKAVLIGEAADKIAKAIGNTVPVEKAASLRDAVIAAYRAAGTGDTVLLSPACASFDMFRNYEDRGRQFKEIVRNLIGEKERGRAW